jgi:hypothetical protein
VVMGRQRIQLRLNGRPDLGTERSYRALPKALDLGLAIGGLGRRENREVEIAPRQRPRVIESQSGQVQPISGSSASKT